MKWRVVVTTTKYRGVDSHIFPRKKDAKEYADYITSARENVVSAVVIKQSEVISVMYE